MATRTSHAQWQGDLEGGSGELSLASGAWSGSYTYASRWEEGDGTNPEELIAAAHAACYSMALSNMLAQAGNTPDSVRTEASIHLEGPNITRIDLVTRGRVPGIDDATFRKHAEEAKTGCPVSKALSAVDITLDATLES